MSAVGDGYCVRSLAETHFAGGHVARHDHAWGQLVYATSGVMHVATADAVARPTDARHLAAAPALP